MKINSFRDRYLAFAQEVNEDKAKEQKVKASKDQQVEEVFRNCINQLDVLVEEAKKMHSSIADKIALFYKMRVEKACTASRLLEPQKSQ